MLANQGQAVVIETGFCDSACVLCPTSYNYHEQGHEEVDVVDEPVCLGIDLERILWLLCEMKC